MSTAGGGTAVSVTNSVTVTGVVANSVTVSSAYPPVVVGGVALPAGTNPTAVGSWSSVLALYDTLGHQRVVVDSGYVTGVMSLVGQPTVTASIAGTIAVTQSTSPWTVLVGSSAGILAVYVTSMGGASSTITGSVVAVGATANSAQVSSAAPPLLTGGFALPDKTNPAAVGSWSAVLGLFDQFGHQRVVVDSGYMTGVVSVAGQVTVTASLIGQPTVTASIIGTVGVTQSTSPWVTLAGSSGALGLVTGSVAVTQAATLQPFTVIVMSTAGGGSAVTVTNSVTVTGVVANSVTVSSAYPPVVMGGIALPVSANPAAVGSWSSVLALYDPLGHQRVVVDSGYVTGVVSVAGQQTVTASVVGQLTVTASLIGTVGVTQSTSPWITLAGSSGAVSLVTGSVLATQGGAPWSVIGSAAVTQAATLQPFTVIVMSTAGGGSAVTVTNSVTVTGVVANSVTVSSAYPPVIMGGVALPAGVNPTAVGSWSSVLAIFDLQGHQRVVVDSGYVTGVVSVAGQQTVQASVVGQLTVTASLIGLVSVVGSTITFGAIANSAQVSSAAPPLLLGGIALPNQTNPAAVGSWSAVLGLFDQFGHQRTVVDSGYVTGVVSVAGQQTVTASIAGTVPVTTQTTLQVYGTITHSAQVSSLFQPTIMGGWAWANNALPAAVGSSSAVLALFDTQGRQRVIVDSMPGVSVSGADGSILDGVLTGIKASVRSYASGVLSLTGQPTVNPQMMQMVASGGFVVDVTSTTVGGALKVDLVAGTISGANGAILDGVNPAIEASVQSYGSGINPVVVQMVSTSGTLVEATSMATGGALRVDLVNGSIAGANGAILDGTDATILASVRSYGPSNNAQVVTLVGTQGLTVSVYSHGAHKSLSTGAVIVDNSDSTLRANIEFQGGGAGRNGLLVTLTDGNGIYSPLSARFLQVTGSVTATVSGQPVTQGNSPWAVGQAGNPAGLTGAPWLTLPASQQMGAGKGLITASMTSPASLGPGGALVTRNIAGLSGPTVCFSGTASGVFSTNAAPFTITRSFLITGLDGYETFMVYTTLTVTNSPTSFRIRPQWNDGLTVTSYYNMGQGLWGTGNTINAATIYTSSLYQSVFVGPVLGRNLRLTVDGDTNTGSGSVIATVLVQFSTKPRWMGT